MPRPHDRKTRRVGADGLGPAGRRRARSARPDPLTAARGARRRPLDSVGVSAEHATVAEEEYLQTMFWLEEAGLPITGANIARAMQLSPPTVHEEAGRLEHAMSPVLEERMRVAIGDAKTCPHGHPIVEGAREEGALLADVETGASVHVLRFENEAEELLHYLKQVGLRPGLDGTLEQSDEDEVVL